MCTSIGNAYCFFGPGRCGLEHNASTAYIVADNTTVTFTGCKCDSSVFDPVVSTCLENNTWLYDLPSCNMSSNICVRPNADVNISCLNEGGDSWSYCEQTDFCVDEKIGWRCPGDDGDLRTATCQCDGNWSAEVCPLPACNATHLQHCGSNITFSSAPSYNGTVPPTTTTTFQSTCNGGTTAMSLCNGSGLWETQGLNMCLLPEVNGVIIWCFISKGDWRKCKKDIQRTEFCQGEKIGWSCADKKWRSTTCQCDGYWEEEVCPEPACSVTDLNRCSNNITYSTDPSYYGIVSTNTTAMFDSHEDSCSPNSVAVTTVCQPGGQWLIESIITCSLPDIGDLDILFCRNKTDNGWKSCEKLRKKSFCSNERIGSFCDTDTWRKATCMCNGTWDENICMPEASSMAVLPLSSISQSPSCASVVISPSPNTEGEPTNTTGMETQANDHSQMYIDLCRQKNKAH